MKLRGISVWIFIVLGPGATSIEPEEMKFTPPKIKYELQWQKVQQD